MAEDMPCPCPFLAELESSPEFLTNKMGICEKEMKHLKY